MNPVLSVGRDGRFGTAPSLLEGVDGSASSGAATGSEASMLDRTAHATAAARSPGLVGRTVAEVERDLILDTLGHCLGNRTQAARILGISIRTLRNKLNDYVEAGIAVPEPGQKPAAA